MRPPVGKLVQVGPYSIKESLNTCLDQLKIKMYDAHTQLMTADETITVESLRNKFQGKVEKPITLIEAFRDSLI